MIRVDRKVVGEKGVSGQVEDLRMFNEELTVVLHDNRVSITEVTRTFPETDKEN